MHFIVGKSSKSQVSSHMNPITAISARCSEIEITGDRSVTENTDRNVDLSPSEIQTNQAKS